MANFIYERYNLYTHYDKELDYSTSQTSTFEYFGMRPGANYNSEGNVVLSDPGYTVDVLPNTNERGWTIIGGVPVERSYKGTPNTVFLDFYKRKDIKTKGDFEENVIGTDTQYPLDGRSGAYWYVRTSTLSETTPPTQPSGGQTIDSNFNITWTRTATDTNTDIELSFDNGLTWKRIASNATGTSLNYNFINEQDTSLAMIRTRAVKGSAAGIWHYSDVFTIYHNLPPTAPGSPNYPVKANRGASINVSWSPSTHPNNSPITYVLERKEDSGSYTQVYSGALTSYTDTVSSSKSTVIYRVKATADGLSSIYATSSVAMIINYPPTLPSQLTFGEPVRNTQVRVEWPTATDPDTGDEIRYYLERSTNSGSTYASVTNTLETFHDENVNSAWTNLKYRLRTYDGMLYSDSYVESTNKSPTWRYPSNPGAPQAPLKVDETAQIGISWAASTQPDNRDVTYRLESSINGAAYSLIYSGSSTTYSQTALSGWTTVKYRVRAYSSPNYTSYVEGSTTAINHAPTVPTSITVPAIKSTVPATITWGSSTDADNNTITYYLYRSKNGGSFDYIYSGKTRSYVDTLDTSYTRVNYRVRAYDERLYSGYATGTEVVLTHNQPAPLPATINMTSNLVGGKNVTVSWSASIDPDGDEVRYYLERAINGQSFVAVTNTLGTSFTETVSSDWNSLQYQIRTFDGLLYSPGYKQTSIGSVFHNTLPTEPSSIAYPSFLLNGDSIQISWSKAYDPDTTDTITYYVERQLNGGSWTALTSTTSLSVNTTVGAWASVAYRVRAYDGTGYSGYRTGLTRTVIINTKPTAPASISITTPVKSRLSATVSWGAATDSDAGDVLTYSVERLVNGETVWNEVADKISTRTFSETILLSWNQVAYRVRAHDGIEYGPYRTLANQTVVHNTPPTVPNGITAPSSARDGDIIYISWGASTDADGDPITYLLEQRINEEPWIQITSVSGASTRGYYDTIGLWHKVQYRVRAETTLHYSPGYAVSGIVQITINQPPTVPPTITVPALNSYSTAVIKWGTSIDPNEDTVYYTLERKIGGAAWTTILNKVAVQQYTETPLTSWTNGVQYRVLAQDDSGAKSGYQTSSTITVKHNIPPLAPTLSMTPPRSGTPTTLSWTESVDPDGDVVTYTVQRKIDNGSWTTFPGTLTGLSMDDNPLESWGAVAYRVRAYDGIDYGAYSNIVTSGVQHFPDFQMRINGSLKSSADGWVRVNGQLRKIDSIWIRVNGVLKKI